MVKNNLFEGWDDGYRRGMFDKCNGVARKSFTGWDLGAMYNRGYADGYDDGYNSHEQRI